MLRYTGALTGALRGSEIPKMKRSFQRYRGKQGAGSPVSSAIQGLSGGVSETPKLKFKAIQGSYICFLSAYLLFYHVTQGL
jgi:hypothetical protein